MEITTALISLAIFVLRLITASKTEAYISHNILLLVASCLYGINAMLLTWRVFGQALEIKKSTGIKQIALRKILLDVIVILIQLAGALLAFTLVFTVIYQAENSYYAKSLNHG